MKISSNCIRKMSTINRAKESAAKAACKFIKEGQTVGLGTGSTANFFISHLGKFCREGLSVQAVVTSEQSYELALHEKIPLVDINSVIAIDLAVDGADEVDQQMRLIKGGGGALFREKIIASMAKVFIVLVDESKMVDHLGKFPLPVEISPFGWQATMHILKNQGFLGHIRKNVNNEIFTTDNGNHIFDINLLYPCLDPEAQEKSIRCIPGVIDTGFFIDMADKIIVGSERAQVKIIDRKR